MSKSLKNRHEAQQFPIIGPLFIMGLESINFATETAAIVEASKSRRLNPNEVFSFVGKQVSNLALAIGLCVLTGLCDSKGFYVLSAGLIFVYLVVCGVYLSTIIYTLTR